MGMLRYQVFLCIGVGLLAFWYGILASGSSDPLLVYFPAWVILGLGVYALGSIGVGVRSCKDFPEALAEIEQQVDEAKKEMKKRGVIKD